MEDEFRNMSVQPEIPEKTLYEVLRDSACRNPDSPACSFLGTRVTYGGLLGQVESLSLSMSSAGVSKGDFVMVCLPNCPQAILAVYAASRLGAVAVMVHPMSSRDEIAFFIRDGNCRTAFTLDNLAVNLPASSGLENIILVPSGKASSAVDGAIKWDDFLEKPAFGRPMPQVSPYDPVSVMYTGGTTGTSKGAVLSSMNFNASALGMKISSGLKTDGQKMLSVLPVFHGFGLCTGIHLPVMMGMEMILLPTFSPEAFFRTLMSERPSMMFGVPTVYEKLLVGEVPPGLRTDFITGLFCGGDSLSSEAKTGLDEFLQSRGCKAKIRIGYGCTECLSAVTIMPDGEDRYKSVGTPIQWNRIKIVKEGTEEEVPCGCNGEICVSGPTVMLRYLNQPEETAQVIRIHSDGVRWLHTGDMGHVDEDGFLYFECRIKRMIITSGYNVYPGEIEKHLNSDPLVKASYVVGVPDSVKVSRVRACLILKDGVEKTEKTAKEINERLAEAIPMYSRPREYVFLDAFPMTKTGKVSCRTLEIGEIGGIRINLP